MLIRQILAGDALAGDYWSDEYWADHNKTDPQIKNLLVLLLSPRNVPRVTLEIAVASEFSVLREAAAQNSTLSPRQVRVLLLTPSDREPADWMAELLVRNGDIDREVLLGLVGEADNASLARFASHFRGERRRTCLQQLLANHGGSAFRMRVAMLAEDSDLLHQVAGAPWEVVRRQVAANKATSKGDLMVLCGDLEPTVRAAAAHKTTTPEEGRVTAALLGLS